MRPTCNHAWHHVQGGVGMLVELNTTGFQLSERLVEINIDGYGMLPGQGNLFNWCVPLAVLAALVELCCTCQRAVFQQPTHMVPVQVICTAHARSLVLAA